MPEFKDFETDAELKAFKESLPTTIQRVCEWARSLIVLNKIYKLNFEEIEKDIDKLGQGYFENECSGSSYDDQFQLLFGRDCLTMIHFLIELIDVIIVSKDDLESYYNDYKYQRIMKTWQWLRNSKTKNKQMVLKQNIKLLTLLISHNIIACYETASCRKYYTSLGEEIFDKRRMLDVIDDDWMQLFVACLNQQTISSPNGMCVK